MQPAKMGKIKCIFLVCLAKIISICMILFKGMTEGALKIYLHTISNVYTVLHQVKIFTLLDAIPTTSHRKMSSFLSCICCEHVLL